MLTPTNIWHCPCGVKSMGKTIDDMLRARAIHTKVCPRKHIDAEIAFNTVQANQHKKGWTW